MGMAVLGEGGLEECKGALCSGAAGDNVLLRQQGLAPV